MTRSVDRTGAAAPGDAGPGRLVVVHADPGAAGIASAIGQLEAAVRQPGRFGALIDARPVGDVPADRPGKREQVRRLRALRPAMAARAAGVAFVTSPAALGGQRRRTRAAHLLLGCPVAVFDAEAPALAWLGARGVDTGEATTALADAGGTDQIESGKTPTDQAAAGGLGDQGRR